MLTGDTLSGISPPRTKEAAMRNSKRKYAGTGGARDGYELKIRLKSKKRKKDQPARKLKGWFGLSGLTQRQQQLTPASCAGEMTNCFDKDFIEII